MIPTASIVADECSTGFYLYKKKKIPFTSCRKFKGLEADAVIILDVDKNQLSNGENQILYVGSSRARFKLSVICNVTDEECNEVLEQLKIKKTKKPGKALAAAF